MATLVVLCGIIVALIAPFYCIYKPPGVLINYFQYRWPDVLWQVETSQKVVALTIDDAPSEYTKEILEVLAANQASATFFVIGAQIPGREAILQDMIRQGHELGNHAMHDEPSKSLDDATLMEQIKAVEGMVNQAYSAESTSQTNRNEDRQRYFRPGSGFFSARMRQLVKRLGYRIVLGGIYPHDPQIRSWRLNARHILSLLRPGAIIICHDRRAWTAPMLRRVLPEARRRGYQIVTISRLLDKTDT